MAQENKQIVLGFSGGLDTTFCVKYLTEDRGFDVHSVIVNTKVTADQILVSEDGELKSE